MCLGLSRPALLRHVDALRALGIVGVEGVPGGEDLGARLVAQAQRLLEARQFDEATHVLGSLLATDPSAASLRRKLEDAQREHLSWLRSRVSATSVPLRRERTFDPGLLTSNERSVLERVNGRWDVGVLVMMSPLRETETLKTLDKLARLGLLDLRAATGARGRA